jgi:hypothetical protein
MSNEVKLQRDLLDLLLTLAPIGLGVLEAEGGDAALKKLRRMQVGQRDPAACRRIITAINERARKRSRSQDEREFGQSLNPILLAAGIASGARDRLANPEIWAALDALPAMLNEKVLAGLSATTRARTSTARYANATYEDLHVLHPKLFPLVPTNAANRFTATGKVRLPADAAAVWRWAVPDSESTHAAYKASRKRCPVLPTCESYSKNKMVWDWWGAQAPGAGSTSKYAALRNLPAPPEEEALIARVQELLMVHSPSP